MLLLVCESFKRRIFHLELRNDLLDIRKLELNSDHIIYHKESLHKLKKMIVEGNLIIFARLMPRGTVHFDFSYKPNLCYFTHMEPIHEYS